MPGPVTLVYDEPMLRTAVRAFVWRRVLRRRRLWLAMIGLQVTCIAIGWYDGPPFMAWLAVASLVFVAAFVGMLWRAHFANTVGRFRTMDPPTAHAIFTEDALTVSSNLGASTIPWPRFVDLWELDRCWLLFLAPNQFLTLPVSALRDDLRTFLRAKVPRR